MSPHKAVLFVALLGIALAVSGDHSSFHTVPGGPRTPTSQDNICSLPADPGFCRAAFPRYYFNKLTHSCTRFTWGGCGGNANNFKTKEECEMRCQSRVCSCPKLQRPVCGSDGQTYENWCFARRAGVKLSCNKACPCKEDCYCIQVFDPVCGIDNKTYGNTCEASCAKIQVACKGQCPCKPQFCLKEENPCSGFLGNRGVFYPRGKQCCRGLECCVCHPRPFDITRPIPVQGFCGTSCPLCRG